MALSTRNYYRPAQYDTPRVWDVSPVETGGAEPVTLAQMKEWLRVDFDEDDDVITALIVAARQGVEMFCNISIVDKNITMTADWAGEWELPYGPVKTITTVASDATLQVLDDGYFTDGTLFKTLRFNCGRVKVVYNAGYTTVPSDLITDIKRVVSYLYEHRGDESLTSLQGGTDRPKGLDEAMELFCKKHKRMQWL